jgi:zinc protease
VRVTNRLFALVAGLLFFLGAAPLQATPRIQTWETPEGVPVLFVAAPDLPMLDVRIAFQAGSARDGNQPGLAALTADLLDQGAGGLGRECHRRTS